MSNKALHLVVLLSRTISPEASLVLDSGQVFVEDDNFIINPPDAISLEEALQFKEKYNTEITVLMISGKEGEKQLRAALAMGADRAVLIECHPSEDEAPSIAKKIAEYLREIDFDIILAGDFSTDGATSQVGPRVAALLDIPFFTKTVKIEKEEESAILKRNTDGDIETFCVPFPFLVTIPQGLHVPRLPSLYGIMKAKKKPLLYKQSEKMGLQEKSEQYTYPKMKRKQTIFQGETQEKVMALAKLLKSLHE